MFAQFTVKGIQCVIAIERGYANEEIATLLTFDAQRFRLGGSLGDGPGLDFSRKSDSPAKRKSKYKKEFFHG